MCTAISVTAQAHYFGRNLDYSCSFGEKITVTPRNYRFAFRNGSVAESHYAIIGMALPYRNYPLYFDATNEKGLSAAGLRFADNAHYEKPESGKENIASFEVIPWLLSQCASVFEAEQLLEDIRITDEAFDETLKPSPLHWMIADRHKTITVEQTQRGFKVFENHPGVLTNNPPFDMQMFYLTNFLSVSPEEPKNLFSKQLGLTPYSKGMGAIGLPGDFSSASRFVKACFLTLNAIYPDSEQEMINHFFHMLYSVFQQKGCVRNGEDNEITHYTSCCNTSRCVYYYTTYDNSQINAVDLYQENLEGESLITYDLEKHQTILVQNGKALQL